MNIHRFSFEYKHRYQVKIVALFTTWNIAFKKELWVQRQRAITLLLRVHFS